MNELSTDSILTKAAQCFTTARKNLLVGASMLHEISTKQLWEGTYSSFNEYVESECQIKPSFASKLITVYQYWVIDNGVSPLNLQGIDTERLYLARKLNGTAEEILLKATTLNRQDLKEELREEKFGEHTCTLGEERWGKCTICDKFHRI